VFHLFLANDRNSVIGIRSQITNPTGSIGLVQSICVWKWDATNEGRPTTRIVFVNSLFSPRESCSIYSRLSGLTIMTMPLGTPPAAIKILIFETKPILCNHLPSELESPPGPIGAWSVGGHRHNFQKSQDLKQYRCGYASRYHTGQSTITAGSIRQAFAPVAIAHERSTQCLSGPQGQPRPGPVSSLRQNVLPQVLSPMQREYWTICFCLRFSSACLDDHL
jgi:hypothetical protein